MPVNEAEWARKKRAEGWEREQRDRAHEQLVLEARGVLEREREELNARARDRMRAERALKDWEKLHRTRIEPVLASLRDGVERARRQSDQLSDEQLADLCGQLGTGAASLKPLFIWFATENADELIASATERIRACDRVSHISEADHRVARSDLKAAVHSAEAAEREAGDRVTVAARRLTELTS